MASFRHPGMLTGLYVILDASVCPDRPLREILTISANAGARIFQYRNKSGSMKEAYGAAVELRKTAGDLGVLFIVNDRCDLALAVDADGVHLGQDDLPYADARRVMGPDRLIGLSTHNEKQVTEADRLKPDYIGFGPIFKPTSKQDHDPVVGIEGLHAIRALTSLPIFAIGGIRPVEVEPIIRAGAHGVAILSAILNAPDVARAVQDFIEQMA